MANSMTGEGKAFAPDSGAGQPINQVGGMSLDALLNELFTYHPARPDQLAKYQAIRDAAKYFAAVVVKNTPPGPDQTAAIRKLRECVMTANAAIALDGLSF